MRAKTGCVVICILWLGLAAPGGGAAAVKVKVGQPPMSPVLTSVLVEELGGPDANARRRALRIIASEYHRRTFPNEVLPLLRAGLGVQDAAVRRDSAHALAGLASKVYISSASPTDTAFGKKVGVDFDSDPLMRGALLDALASRDPMVRRKAPVALGLAYPAAPDIEAALLARWKAETKLMVRRDLIIAMGRGGYASSETLAVFRRASTDPDRVLRWRARRCLRSLGHAVPPSPKSDVPPSGH